MWGLQFTQPEFLWLSVLLPILVIAHFLFLRRNQKKALRFANFEAIKRIAGRRMVTQNFTILLLRLLTFTVLILSLSGASLWYDGVQNDFDYVIAIDTSTSMIAGDYPPSRFEAAKEASLTLLNTIDSSAEFGLVTFSGVTFIEERLTNNRLDVKMTIPQLNVTRASGTDISGGIVTSVNLFTDDNRGKAIVLLTDGVDTAGSFIDDNVKQAVRYAKNNNVVIYPVGIGTENAPVGYLPERFNLTSSIDVPTLNYMANQTGGKALFPETTQGLLRDFEEFDSFSTETRVPVDLTSYGYIAVIVLLFMEWVLISTVFRRVV